jgi:hypothetical protein
VCPDDADDTLDGAYTPPTLAIDTASTSLIDVPASRRTSQLALVVLAVAAGGFLLGIGTASIVPRPDDDGVPPLVAQQVGPSGGIVRFDGGEVRVPSGALAGQRTIEVHRFVVDRRVRVDPGGKADPIVFAPGRLVAYRFEPEDVTFAEPVQIAFRLPAGAENGTVFARGSRGGIVLLEGKIDADRGTATTVVRDFRFGGAAP